MAVSGSHTPEDGLYGEWCRLSLSLSFKYHNIVLPLQLGSGCRLCTVGQIFNIWNVAAINEARSCLQKFVPGVNFSPFLPAWEQRSRSRCRCCCGKHCHCINGFSDSPVCISVSQLTCGDFLTLIAARCRVHISWLKGFWVKHVDSCS